MDTLPLALIAPLLVLAAYCDLRFLRIPNMISILIVAVFAMTVYDTVPDDLVARLVAASLVFVAGFAAFAARLVGGGDVKLLTALVLFIPTDRLMLFANVFAISLLIGVAVVVSLRHGQLASPARWKFAGQPKSFPMGLSIAMAGVGFWGLVSHLGL